MKMRSWLAALFCGVLASSAFAGSTPAKDEPPFTLTQAGFQLGLNFSSLSTNGTVLPNGTDGHTGLIVGGQVEMSLLANMLFLQPELRLVQQGYSLTGTSSSDITINYLDIPILAKFKFESMPGMRPYLLFGPEIAMKLGSSYDSYWGSSGPPVNLWNFALDFGAGIEYDLNPSTNFFGERRYSLGLNNINGDNSNPLTEQFHSVQLTVGLNFGL
jgi:opacity protein-like surface antigen